MRQLRLPKMPGKRKLDPFARWQIAGDKENELLDTLEREYEDGCSAEEYDALEAKYNTAHAVTLDAFAPLAPRVKDWWVK